MSATNRGAQRERDDFYETPRREIDILFDRLGVPVDSFDRIVEPASGAGAIVQTAIERGAQPENILAIECDNARAEACRAHGCEVIEGDTLTTPTLPNVGSMHRTLIVTNPPFSQALLFAKWCLALRSKCREGSLAALLLRVNFLGSAKRRPFWNQNPAHVIVLSRRPSFCVLIKDRYQCTTMITGDDPCDGARSVPHGAPPPLCPKCGRASLTFKGQVKSTTDSTEYAWFVWTGRHVGGRGTWEVA